MLLFNNHIVEKPFSPPTTAVHKKQHGCHEQTVNTIPECWVNAEAATGVRLPAPIRDLPRRPAQLGARTFTLS